MQTCFRIWKKAYNISYKRKNHLREVVIVKTKRN